MRQNAEKADRSLSWKQEVNRRVAEHKERKGQPASSQDALTESHPEGSVAALAAARVAARYAKAPSYSEMLAAEARPTARATVRPMESALVAVVEAPAAATPEPAVLEAAPESFGTQASEPEFFTTADRASAENAPVEGVLNTPIATPSMSATAQVQSFEIRWDADMPVRDSGPALARASVGDIASVLPAESLSRERRGVRDALETQGFEEVEAAQPIHANLIAFPRELVATRKIRPRRVEGPYAAMVEAQGQLSIFEVEPTAISIEPEAASAKAEAVAHTWVGPEWTGIELDEEPKQVTSSATAPAKVERAKPASVTVTALQLAPLSQRVLAAIVDFSLITAAFLAATLVAAMNTTTLPSAKEIELGSMVAWALIGALYQAFFFTLSRATPGMDYARLTLCTYAGKRPSLAQRFVRSSALFLSLLPLGFGVIWGIFDEHNLTWHDRLSGTYLRKG